MRKSPKDLFSEHAEEYQTFRPTYPEDLFRYLSSLAADHSCAWDAATGNGQAAFLLTPYFDRVIATDISRRQIDNAVLHEKIFYHVAPVEHTSIDENSIDLTTVAQAFHWFDHDVFVEELIRVSKKDAVLAIWCYGLMTISTKIDAIIYHLYENILGPYWDPERKMVENDYVDVKLPFTKIIAPSFSMTAEWTLSHVVGYVRTWSAYKKFVSKNGALPLEQIFESLKEAWGRDSTRPIHWLIKPKIWRLEK